MDATTDTDVAQFARICASLAVWHGARASMLANLGLDEATWKRTCELWAQGMLHERETATRFVAAFAASVLELRQQTTTNLDETIIGPSRAANRVLPFQPAEDALGATTDVPLGAVRGPALPFASSSEAAAPADIDVTLVPSVASQSSTVLPFAPWPRRQRMLRFDTQTGQPLASPIWVDEPEAPNER